MSIKEPITREQLMYIIIESLKELDDFLFTKICNVLVNATITITYKEQDVPPEYTIEWKE